MAEEHPHPLLAQLPLTVSPFVSLPTATPLPYSYKQLPATLPPSVTDPMNPQNTSDQSAQDGSTQQQPAYVISAATGHSAHPDQIIASCHALQAHLAKLQSEAQDTVRKWQDGIRERELAEKRRVAPGWLDAEQRMLVPERKGGQAVEDVMMMDDSSAKEGSSREERGEDGLTEGEQMDRAFGSMALR